MFELCMITDHLMMIMNHFLLCCKSTFYRVKGHDISMVKTTIYYILFNTDTILCNVNKR